MPSLKLFPWLALTTLGTSVVGTAGTYGATLTTIENHLKDDLLGEDASEDNDWKELQKALNGTQNINIYGNSGLESAQQKDKQTPEDGNSIKEWCKRQKSTKISTYFEFLSSNLLKAVRDFCIRTIGDKLGENKVEAGNEETIFKTKLKSINTHKTEQHGKLDQELESLKTENPENNWFKLQKWCNNAYKRGYNKQNDNLWKLANHYCNKN